MTSTSKKNKKPKDPLCQCVRRSLKRYIKDLNGTEPKHLYGLVMGEIERPLFEVVMEKAEGNQTKAAEMLGINRNTLRKKLKQYRLA